MKKPIIFTIFFAILNSSLPVQANQTLFNAAASGDLRTLDHTLKYDPTVDVNYISTFGGNALGVAAEKGYIRVVNRLLREQKINVNLGDFFQPTALTRAAFKNQTKIVKRLLKVPGIHVDGDITGDWAYRPCSNARRAIVGAIDQENNDIHTLKMLLKHPEIKVTKCDSETLLDVAVRAKNSRAFRLLLRLHPELLNSVAETKSLAIAAIATASDEILETVLSYTKLKAQINTNEVYSSVMGGSAWGFKVSNVNNLKKFFRYFDFNQVSDEKFITSIERTISNGDVDSMAVLAPLRPKLLNRVFKEGREWWIADNLSPLEYVDNRINQSSDSPQCGSGFSNPEPCEPTRANYIKLKLILEANGAEHLGIKTLVEAAERDDVATMENIVKRVSETGLKINSDRHRDSVGDYRGSYDGAVIGAVRKSSLNALQYLLNIPEVAKNIIVIQMGVRISLQNNLLESVQPLLKQKGLNLNEKDYFFVNGEWKQITLTEYAVALSRTEILKLMREYRQ